jgi:hypothetical protein
MYARVCCSLACGVALQGSVYPPTPLAPPTPTLTPPCHPAPAAGNPLLGSPSCSALTCPNSTALGASLLPTASAQATSCYSPCYSSPAGQQQQQEEEEQQQGGDEGQSG